jgi:CBS domain-containing protein
MKVHEIMTAHARCVGPDTTLVEAAGLMRELDVGALPVCDNDRIAGMVTDRDMVLRGTADGRDPNSTSVRDVMSPGVFYVFADQEVEEAAQVMEEKQIRRVPVLNREKRLVGILSLGDIATSSNPAFSGMALRDVSQPAEPSARQRRLAQDSEPADMPNVPGERQAPAGRSKSRGGSRERAATKKRSSRTTGSARSARSSRGSNAKRAGAGRKGASAGRGSRGKTSARGRSRSRQTSARGAR